MKIAVLREPAGETRSALVPESVRALAASNTTVHIESGAGNSAGATDADYAAAGATIELDKAKLLQLADVLICVNRPSDDDVAQLRAGAVVIGFLKPLDEPDSLVQLIERGLTAFAMELIPRSTRAQAMDALSSMATITGLQGGVVTAERLPRMFPC